MVPLHPCGFSQEFQINDYFIEFGTGDYKESNTRYLLQNSNWSGSLIEGNKNDYDKIVFDDLKNFIEYENFDSC